MSGRFPGAADVGELWRNLLAGELGLRQVTEEELEAAGARRRPAGRRPRRTARPRGCRDRRRTPR
ncbi:hypothetical protein IM697_29610 [Streptomyces ferrugineus]|uniref:Beta-ketoacyl synthase-like N-terminal domain-containing protein n=1 Tax=Streptomyces ferrugineus TaxID=1413221 RepID=A0A7M2SY73_9ACTN|nr:hypothetical protein IM697_29610 [Streptomyces ferrugineus]